MRLLVLAGGFGTRLKAAIANVPKALAPIGDIPFLQLQIENWLAQGLREFTFLLHHQADQIIDFLRAQQTGLLMGCQVNWVIEPTPMDTGGAIAYAVNELNLDGEFLITNADTWLGGGIREIMSSKYPAIAIVNLVDISRYGQVHFSEDGYVTAFAEKTSQSVAGWINAGLYHLHTSLFSNWDKRPFSLERELFINLVNNHNLKAVPLRTDFVDIGVPDDYHRFVRCVSADRQVFLCN